MQQYLDLLKEIRQKGTLKPAARAGMPGTLSLFGHQFRHDLSTGFPLLTTKKMFWKGVVVELLWFLRGNTNIKFLHEYNVHIWDGDAYNYYSKKCSEQGLLRMSLDSFLRAIKNNESLKNLTSVHGGLLKDYILGDCGFQYGRVWRDWECVDISWQGDAGDVDGQIRRIDQVADLLHGLKTTPEGRRHILTAWDPAHVNDLALTWCHALVQFNCRPLTASQREDEYAKAKGYTQEERDGMNPNASDADVHELMDEEYVPKYYLDCHLYQRSADTILGVPFNIASYALLTHIFAKICHMIPGDFIHTFGDVHIYENHMAAAIEQLEREPRELPKLMINQTFFDYLEAGDDLDNFIVKLSYEDFSLKDYNPHPPLVNETKLSTGI